ncbi:MAG: adenylyltransferase/cytidyltransferase family protein [Verrucomicrobia bacterium]|nr:adenylyltransferase/cytidyltransferase family protein [Verrucomicrobiota bacterium]MCH8512856.1 adenylyltransferase/cytidyltransferase family protein [Kiritimatiellia bacterium]
MRTAQSKILSPADALVLRHAWNAAGDTVVMTNGTFDLLHAGHTGYLEWARSQGDRLIVGLNSDASIRRIKGEKRPLVEEPHRATLLAALECVDAVVVFDEDEPKDLIARLLPDILVKAEDWSHYVSGRDIVEAHGGEVRLASMVDGLSTSALLDKICRTFTGRPAQLDPQTQRREAPGTGI